MPDPRDVSVYNLLMNTVCAMVDNPDAVFIKTIWNDNGADFGINCHPDDKGKLIGAGGRNARSLRVIMQAIGMGRSRSYAVLVDE